MNGMAQDIIGSHIDMRLGSAQVKMVVARTGVKIFGKEKLIWESTLVLTDQGQKVFTGEPYYQDFVYHYVRQRHPNAVAMALDGSVQLPDTLLNARNPPLQAINDALILVGKELSAAKWRIGENLVLCLGGGVVLLVLGVIGIFTLFALALGLHALIGAFVLLKLASDLVDRACQVQRRHRMVMALVREISDRCVLPTEALASLRTPLTGVSASGVFVRTSSSVPGGTPEPVAAPPPGVSVLAGLVSVLAIMTMVCPGLGTIVALVGLLLTYKHSSWARVLVGVALAVNLLMLLLVAVVTLLGNKAH